MKRVCLWIILIILGLSISVEAQNTTKTIQGRVLDEDGLALEQVSVCLLDSLKKISSYTITSAEGVFEISYTQSKSEQYLKIGLMGYETLLLPISTVKNQDLYVLTPNTIKLRAVSVKAPRITQKKDTLVYHVTAFKSKTDRSISDVIAKMPGLEVSPSGQIRYQGRAINKFYIEGLDLMGNKYAQASANLSVRKVKAVEVLEHHQPVKTLRGVRFSEQAALNIVLKDNAQNVFSGVLDLGGGLTLNKPIQGLYDARLMGMFFGKKRQNLSLYKTSSTGKNIAYELRDQIRRREDLKPETSLVEQIKVYYTGLEAERSRQHDSHLVGLNHLLKTGEDSRFRLQLSYLWDKERSKLFKNVYYTSLSSPNQVVVEQSQALAYSNRLESSLQYQLNSAKYYLKNTFKGYLDFSRSQAETMLNGAEFTHFVKPHSQALSNQFELIKSLSNGRSLNIKSENVYTNLPSELSIAGGDLQELRLQDFHSKSEGTFVSTWTFLYWAISRS